MRLVSLVVTQQRMAGQGQGQEDEGRRAPVAAKAAFSSGSPTSCPPTVRRDWHEAMTRMAWRYSEAVRGVQNQNQ